MSLFFCEIGGCLWQCEMCNKTEKQNKETKERSDKEKVEVISELLIDAHLKGVNYQLCFGKKINENEKTIFELAKQASVTTASFLKRYDNNPEFWFKVIEYISTKKQ